MTPRFALAAVLFLAAYARAESPRGRDLWSLRPVADPAPPAVRDPAWALSPIDRFILAKLEEKGLHPAGPADKRTLIRRATFDLTGLPPTPEEVEAFVHDPSPGAFAKVVDRLLASPAYGERWGRHWLDLVRYADTAGDNSDYPVPHLWRYRNWVIGAFNRDLPYDQFVREQLAGDLMPRDGSDDRLIATGYLANARRFGSYEDARYPWHLTIEDTIDNLGRTFLGLTINCCRCHDHKFDPLTQEDYYALYGFFQSTRYPWPGIELDKAAHDLVPLTPPEQAIAYEKARRDRLAELDARLQALEKAKADAKAVKTVRDERERVLKEPPPFEVAYAVAERPAGGKRKVGNACVQIKGDPDHPGREVPRRFPTVLGGQALPPDAKDSGRLELAGWIADPKNPLTARVMVNRIWQHHFGTGIVPTPADFGRQGRPPSHPELLDYLAYRFIDSGWSVKAMHRLVMLSRTYQLAGTPDDAGAAIDPANELLGRFPRHRLDAEQLRDALLAAAGRLDRSPGGPHPFPDPRTWDYTQHKPFKAVYETDRRGVYLMAQRVYRHPFLGLFDGADPNSCTARRVTSTSPLQALYLMNDPQVHALAAKFAARLLAESGDDAGRLDRAYRLLFARPPEPDERAAILDYLGRVRAKLPADGREAKAWESVARALFATNEFVYVN